MKRVALIILMLISLQLAAIADVLVYQSGKDKFGLKDETGKTITEAKYKKLVRLGDKAWIMQDGTKFGILHDSGKVIVEPKYRQAERVLGKYAKLAKGDKYGIFDEMGFEILPVEYSSIDLLYGGMFVTGKNYKYGISDLNGLVILDNIFDDIYMPEFNKLILVYQGNVYEITKDEQKKSIKDDIQLHYEDINDLHIIETDTNALAMTGYFSVTFTDYILKLISSISPAYEQTIDELMFSQGADTVSVLMKCTWLPKFPFVYTKKYYRTMADPYNGPLSKIKRALKRNIKN